MDDKVEQDETGEVDSIDAETIKSVFKQYVNLMEKLPEARPEQMTQTIDTKQAIFVLDHRGDPNTKFKGEEISCFLSTMPIQEQLDHWPPFSDHIDQINTIVRNPQKGEGWIMVSITPGDLYRPKFAKHKSSISFQGDTEQDLWWLETDELVIAFSETGKALEARVWKSFGKTKNKDREDYKHGRDRLKEDIRLENLPQVDTAATFSEPIQTLHGSSLERLKYIAHQASIGNIANWSEVFKRENPG